MRLVVCVCVCACMCVCVCVLGSISWILAGCGITIMMEFIRDPLLYMWESMRTLQLTIEEEKWTTSDIGSSSMHIMYTPVSTSYLFIFYQNRLVDNSKCFAGLSLWDIVLSYSTFNFLCRCWSKKTYGHPSQDISCRMGKQPRLHCFTHLTYSSPVSTMLCC